VVGQLIRDQPDITPALRAKLMGLNAAQFLGLQDAAAVAA